MARILSLDVADEAGISYRQLDHWTRKGYISPRRRDDGSGSGVEREFDESELAVAVEMGALVRAGFTPRAAAPLARALLEAEGERLDDPLVIVPVRIGPGHVVLRAGVLSIPRLSAPAASVDGMGENK